MAIVPTPTLTSDSWPALFCMAPENALDALPLPMVKVPSPDKLSIVPTPLMAPTFTE